MTEDRMERLKLGALGREAKTIEVMIRKHCRDKGHSADGQLCQECQDLLAYALKRLACCPYGHKKPVCNKCQIHCYRAKEKQQIADVMRYSGPRLIFSNPILAMDHMIKTVMVRPPEKPRNRKTT